MHLSSLAVILVFAGEAPAFKAVENFPNRLRRLGKHGFERDTRCQLAHVAKIAHAVLEQSWNNLIVCRQLAE